MAIIFEAVLITLFHGQAIVPFKQKRGWNVDVEDAEANMVGAVVLAAGSVVASASQMAVVVVVAEMIEEIVVVAASAEASEVATEAEAKVRSKK